MILVNLGGVFAYLFGLVDYIISADVTYITLLITTVYLWCASSIIWSSYKEDKSKCEHYTFIADLLPQAGLIGTVAGLIISTSGPLAEALNDPSKIKEVLEYMSNGVGSALLTTGAGILGNVLLKIKIRILGGA